jgi:calcium-dependent protein kinase
MKNYDLKADMWSCGVVLYIMICGRPPFNDDNDLEIMRMIKEGQYGMKSRVWDRVSSHAKDLIRSLMCYNPKKRLTAE